MSDIINPIGSDTATGQQKTLNRLSFNASSLTAGRVIIFPNSDVDLGNIVTPSSVDTFTNKTFDANGAGNSISNIDVADLADGTDGELITWSAGSPTTVGAGTVGQVLTSNGAGSAPTFQDASSGGAGSIIAEKIFISDATTHTFNTANDGLNHKRVDFELTMTSDQSSNGTDFVELRVNGVSTSDYNFSHIHFNALGSTVNPTEYASQNEFKIGRIVDKRFNEVFIKGSLRMRKNRLYMQATYNDEDKSMGTAAGFINLGTDTNITSIQFFGASTRVKFTASNEDYVLIKEG